VGENEYRGIRRRQKQGAWPRHARLSSPTNKIGDRIRRERRINHDLDLILELSFGNTRQRDGASVQLRFLNLKIPHVRQILESGFPATSVLFNASHGETAWQTFVSGVASCTQTATSGHTLDCLRRANSSDIAPGLRTSLLSSSDLYPLFFAPTLDGPNGLIPDYPSKLFPQGRFARVPFIAGTNLDEGEIILFYNGVGIVSYLIHSGTTFISRTINSEKEVYDFIVATFSPPIVSPWLLDNVVKNILCLYPDIPALGSPFGTGNETFGLSSVFKQTAAIG